METWQDFEDILIKRGIQLKENEITKNVDIVEMGEVLYGGVFERSRPYDDLYDETQFQDLYHSETGKRISERRLKQYVRSIGCYNAYNPVAQYLEESCESWNGVSAFPKLYEIMGIKDELSKTLIKTWFVECVALAHNASEQFGFDAYSLLPLVLKAKTKEERNQAELFFERIVPDCRWQETLKSPTKTQFDTSMFTHWIVAVDSIKKTLKKLKVVGSYLTNGRVPLSSGLCRRFGLSFPYDRTRTSALGIATNEDKPLDETTGTWRWCVVDIPNEIKLSHLYQETVNALWGEAQIIWEEDNSSYLLPQNVLNEMTERNYKLYYAE